MTIEGQGLPYARQPYRFVVSGVTGRTLIEAYVDTRRILRTECPDPPCHEMVQIPEHTRGSILRVIAFDSAGKRIEREFTIADSEASAGGMMSSARG
jgi:hypothetical protein